MSKPLKTKAENRFAPLIEKQGDEVPAQALTTPPCLPCAMPDRAMTGGGTPPTLSCIPVALTPFRVSGVPHIEIGARRWAKGSGVGGLG